MVRHSTPRSGRPSARRTSRAGSMRAPTWRTDLKLLSNPRILILAGLLLTYIWRFHDLSPILSPLRLAALATVGSWAYLLLKPRAAVLGRVLKLPYVWLFLAWSAWMGLTVGLALVPRVAWTAWYDGHFKTITMFLFTLTCLTSFQMVRFASAVHVLGGAVLALFYMRAGFPQSFTPVPGYDRNDLALALNIVLPLALYLAFASRSRGERAVFLLSALSIATSVLMSQSRGGFVALAGIVAFTLIRVRGVKLRYRVIPPILLLGSLPFLPVEIQDRLSTILTPTEDYNYDHEVGRIEIWKRGLGYVGDFPVTGVGMENFPIAEYRFSGLARLRGSGAGPVTHNSFLQVASESGVTGFLLYMGMILTALHRLYRIRKRFDRLRAVPDARNFVLAADFTMVSILGFCFGGFFISRAYSPMLFILIALTAGLELGARAWFRGRTRERPRVRVTRPSGQRSLARRAEGTAR